MKRILVFLLSLTLLTAQAEELSTPSDVFVEFPTSEELFASEAVDEPVDEYTPFEIIPDDAADPEESELLIPEDAHAVEQPTSNLADLDKADELTAEKPAPLYFTVTCYATETSLTYVFTPIVEHDQENTP